MGHVIFQMQPTKMYFAICNRAKHYKIYMQIKSMKCLVDKEFVNIMIINPRKYVTKWDETIKLRVKYQHKSSLHLQK